MNICHTDTFVEKKREQAVTESIRCFVGLEHFQPRT